MSIPSSSLWHQLTRASILLWLSSMLCHHDTGHARHLVIIAISCVCIRTHIVIVVLPWLSLSLSSPLWACVLLVVTPTVPRHRHRFHCCRAYPSPPPSFLSPSSAFPCRCHFSVPTSSSLVVVTATHIPWSVTGLALIVCVVVVP